MTQELARVEAALAERIPTRMVPDLARITDLMALLGSPQLGYPSIHLTGTNGKTSTTRMVDALLRAFGLRPGRYTSPHLASVTERIAVDGVPLDGASFAAAYDEIAHFLEIVDQRHEDTVTYFETLTAMAFAAFADAPVDVGVIEVGMGGVWDATNVLRAATCVVMPIGLDHKELGDTVEEVAAEKAGIVHEHATVVVAPQEMGAARVLLERAVAMEATVVRAGLEFDIVERRIAVGGQVLAIDGIGGRYEEVFLPLHGRHQAVNAACALAAVECFLGGGRSALDLDAVRAGFAAADSPGRLEVVRRGPTVLLDGAHNPAGVRALSVALEEEFQFDGLVGVVAVLGDKDVASMLAGLEHVLDQVVVTTNASPRAMPADALGRAAVQIFGTDRVSVAVSLPDALDEAVALADDIGPGAGVLVTGSLYTVGEARRLIVGK